MGQICITCNHAARLQIDRELISGISLSKISKEYGLPYSSVLHHKENHLTHQLVSAMQKKQLAENFNLLDRVDDLLAKADKIFQRNYERGKDRLALQALSEIRGTLDLLARISWLLHEAKRLENQENAEADQYEQELQIQSDLSVLTLPELKMFNQLSQKLESQDRSMIVIPENKRLYSNPHLGHSHNPADEQPYRGNKGHIYKQETTDRAKFSDNARPKKRFVRTRPRITGD